MQTNIGLDTPVKKAKILLPEFVTEAIITEECQKPIFPKGWIDNVLNYSRNQKLVLSDQIKKILFHMRVIHAIIRTIKSKQFDILFIQTVMLLFGKA